jgi:hypothetical protein
MYGWDKTFRYQSPDCSGAPYLLKSDTDRYVDFVVRCSAEERYFVPRGPSVKIQRRSRGDCGETACTGVETVEWAYPVLEISPDDIPFTLPAAVPFRYVHE